MNKFEEVISGEETLWVRNVGRGRYQILKLEDLRETSDKPPAHYYLELAEVDLLALGLSSRAQALDMFQEEQPEEKIEAVLCFESGRKARYLALHGNNKRALDRQARAFANRIEAEEAVYEDYMHFLPINAAGNTAFQMMQGRLTNSSRGKLQADLRRVDEAFYAGFRAGWEGTPLPRQDRHRLSEEYLKGYTQGIDAVCAPEPNLPEGIFFVEHFSREVH